MTKEFQIEKISPQFASTLDRLGPKVRVRVILVLDVFSDKNKLSVQRKALHRRATLDGKSPQLSRAAVGNIDRILHRFHGKRLTKGTDNLGSIFVETTAAGVEALAASQYVLAILEDQPIFASK